MASLLTFSAVRKLLLLLKRENGYSTEEQPILIGSKEKPSRLKANSYPFMLNRSLSSHLKLSLSSCLEEFEPQDHLDGGKTSLNMYCMSRHKGALPDQTQVAGSHLSHCCHLL